MGTVFNIQKFSIHDGPGIRTTVFLKGCSLRCRWCANPESITRKAELGLVVARCNKCQKCLSACPEQALRLGVDDAIHIDRNRCNGCGKCVEVCYPQALMLFGTEMSAGEVFAEVRRDEIFYQGSGGGVTVSGGEPLHQPKFVIALFQLCHEAGIKTCLDTTGYAKSQVLTEVLPLVDYVLYDLKHMNPKVHRQFTGTGNRLILANAKLVAMSGLPMLCRIPLIPGANDTAENLTATARFVKTLRSDMSIELLPYHRMGVWKYPALDKPYPMEGTQPPEMGYVEYLRKMVESLGLRCSISK